MRRVIIGTAGHIDHGKTALVKALTGIDTDRLQEEKERGISIDLGFAHFDLPDGIRVGVVDVPGHERFIKNMLAGVGGIDLVLFVVACDEGVMPQTREHFEIVTLLGVKQAVFALTKSDMVDRDQVEAVREEVREFLAPTRFKDAPLVPTSTKTGEGLEELRRILEETIRKVDERKIGEVVRLPVDRVFSVAGRGTVVTGTLWSGAVSEEDRLEIQPGAKPVRVRSVEVHGEAVEQAFAGQRTALGLHGVEKSEVERGWCVVSPGDFEASSILDIELLLLNSAQKPLETRARIRFHLGASETIGRIFLLDREALTPGGKCFAQVRLETRVVAGFDDAFVVRTYSPARTVGGGRVLDPLAGGHKRKDASVVKYLAELVGGDLARAAEVQIRRAPQGIGPDALRKKLNCGPSQIASIARDLAAAGRIVLTPAGSMIHAEALRAMESRIEEVLRDYQAQHRLTWGIPKEELRERLGSLDPALVNWLLGRLEAARRITTRKGTIRAGSATVDLSPAEARARSLVIDLLKRNLFQPPSEREIEAQAGIPPEAFRKVVNLLVEESEIVRLEPGLVVHETAITEGAARIVAYLKEHSEATASDLKGALGTTRKYAVPLLEHLDRIGITRRRGDKRTLA